MTSALFEEIRINAQNLVSESLVAYEKKFGSLTTDLSRRKFLDSGLELLRRVIDRVEAKDEISILSFKEILLVVVLDLDFNTEAMKSLLQFVVDGVIEFIKKKPNYDANLTRILNTYLELFYESVDNLGFYASSEAVDILQGQPEYQYSEALYSVLPKELDSTTNRVYTLFPKARYWEAFSSAKDEELYSPLGYNRFASSLGLSKYSIPLSYDYLVIFNGELYKLRPDVTDPTRSYFEESEWVKYVSRRLDQTKSFRKVFQDNIRSAFGKFTEFGFDSNGIVSDSYVSEFSDIESVDENLLFSTFGGGGKQVVESVRQLKEITDAFGSYEGSPVGGVEYIVRFSEYILAAGLGRNTPEIFDFTNGDSIFGKFNVIFKSGTVPNKIAGLKFLNGFGLLKSFAQAQTLPENTPVSDNRVVYNPVYSQFSSGLEDRFVSLETSVSYREPARVDLLLYALESIYKRCLLVGDTVKAILNTLDGNGRAPGHEGLGSISTQMREFQRVFPPTSYFTGREKGPGPGAGLSGSIKYLLDNYSRFSSAVIRPVLPGRSLEFFGPWIERINNKLEEVVQTLKRIGISTSEFLPNIFFKAYEANDKNLIGLLSSLGFRDSEINKLLEVQSFSQLVESFAPLTDSSDLKSFFKAYELAQLVYEFGGQEAVDTYLSFLYRNNELDSLLNILDLSQKDKSRLTYVNLERYPKLIGLLIGLTYAVDPSQLVKFERILGQNNLSLLESISYLYQNGETTIIKDRNEIQFLQPLVEQMITGVYRPDALSSPTVLYPQANAITPIALKQWTKVIGDNLGQIESSKVLEGLYDRAKGLTPKELFSVLNGPSSTTTLGHVLDGFSGGSFTAFLRYATLAGLGVKLGNYKNSYQMDNFKVDTSYKFYALPELVVNLEELIKYISIIKTIFNAQLNYNFESSFGISNLLEPLVLSQNKSYETMPQIISSISSGESIPSLTTIASTASIAESPGIGNSRVPNRVPVVNSVTPEQARQISQYSSQVMELGIVDELPINFINRFIKFSEANQLANGIITSDEVREPERLRALQKKFSPATKYEQDVSSQRPAQKPFMVKEIYKKLDGDPTINTDVLGASYVSGKTAVEVFDPVRSCQRFGGSECEALYAESQERCVTGFNKSLFPETYQEVPGSSPSRVSVDRPLGTFSEYVPSSMMIPGSSFKDPPAFTNLLPPGTSIGRKGEPVLENLFSEPFTREYGGSELSELGNTEFGVVEFIKANLEKNSEFTCATFDSPFYYQICMNVMKCKRFSPPYNGEYHLDFCPKTLSGGRLK